MNLCIANSIKIANMASHIKARDAAIFFGDTRLGTDISSVSITAEDLWNTCSAQLASYDVTGPGLSFPETKVYTLKVSY